MAFTVEVNGVTKDAYTRYRTLRIEKHGGMETCRLEFLDPDTSASAFRVVPGDVIRVSRDGGASLEFGGEATRVTDKRLDGGDGGGTITVVEARNWYFEAADIRIPVLILPAQGLYISAEYLRSTYLDAKGWVTLNPTTGGPDLPLLVYTDNTIAEIFDDLTKKSGYPWRVNGDREMAFVEPGSLTAPHTYDNTNSIVLRGATWTQERVRRATRLLITTGGTGQHIAHHEDHAADGVKTHFPVNVLPPEMAGAINNAAGYAAAATSLAVDGLPKSYTMKAGSTLRFGAHAGYALASDATTDATGAATISITPGLDQAVVDDEAVTFGAETFVQLEVAGTPTALDGSPWSFDAEQAMFITSGAAPASGNVTYRTLFNLPARVRTWAAAAQNADGSFDYGAVRDAVLNWPEFADVVQAKEAGDTELTYRTAEPKELKLATFAQDVYPWMMATCSFPERLISGEYMVQSVILTDVGRRDLEPRVELTLLEGSRIGRDWRAYWMGKDSGAAYVPAVQLSQMAIEVMVRQDQALLSQMAIETMVRDTLAAVQMSQLALEVMVA